MRKIIYAGLAATMIWGCSVKEDRSTCPAWLNVGLSQRSLAIACGQTVRLQFDTGERTDTLALSEVKPGEWITLKRGKLNVEALLENGAGLTVPWGAECDSLWAFSCALSLNTDEERLEVELHKRFATVWFSFDSEPDYENTRLVIRSDIAGTDITRMSPVRGEFRCLLRPREGELSVRLPAQGRDSELSLECSSPADGIILWTWNLGAALKDAGYDWEADDLADIRVRVSPTPLHISVETIPWAEGGPGLVLEI